MMIDKNEVLCANEHPTYVTEVQVYSASFVWGLVGSDDPELDWWSRRLQEDASMDEK